MSYVTGHGDFSIGSEVWPGVSKVLEEGGELAQVLGKLIGSHGDPAHFDGTDLVARIEDEVGDLQAALMFLVDVNPALSGDRISNRAANKLRLFHEWHGAETPGPCVCEGCDMPTDACTCDGELLELPGYGA